MGIEQGHEFDIPPFLSHVEFAKPKPPVQGPLVEKPKQLPVIRLPEILKKHIKKSGKK